METAQKNIKKNSSANFSNTKIGLRTKNLSFFNNQKQKSLKDNIQAGDILNVKITALGSKNIGVAELKNGYTVLVPNTKCGDKVEVKVEKILNAFGPRSTKRLSHSVPNQKIKYIVATLNNDISTSANIDKTTKPTKNIKSSTKFDLKVGQRLKVTIVKKGPKNSGLIPISKNFLLIVPNVKVGEKVYVEIQKIKQNYAFAKTIVLSGEKSTSLQNAKDAHKINSKIQTKSLGLAQQFYVLIPSTAKTFGNYFVVKLNGNILFVKKALGVQMKDTVKIQIQKSTKNFALAKILEISPISTIDKKLMVKQTLQKMIKSSMHFGEKAIRCNANMRKYIWYRKKNLGMYTNSQKMYLNTIAGFSHTDRISDPTNGQHPSSLMSTGMHFAQIQQNTLWSPKSINEFQKPMVKRGRHVLNVLKTQRCFEQALKQLAKYAIKGNTFLFVGTKKPAASLIAKTALLTKTSFFVNTRWLGGMLTNWKTILKSISQIRPILKQKQKILQKILEKRQKIQRRLLNKVFLLRKKSQQFMIKGKYLIQKILVSKNFLIERSQQLMQKKNAILSSNMALLNAAKSLKLKKNRILKQIQQLELAATEIVKQKKQVKSLVTVNIATFEEIEQFFEIGKQLVKTKNLLETNGEKKFVALSYEKFLTAKDLQNSLQSNSHIPNPSPEIFQKMISVLSNLRKTDLFETKTQNIGVSFALNRSKSTSNTSVSENTEIVENQTILLSKFLNKFIAFLPFFKNSLQILSSRLSQQQKMLQELYLKLYKISESQKLLTELYKKTVSQLSIVFEKFVTQQKNFKNFQKSLKQLASEQRLLKFLPKLRYLPTSQLKMYETVELFMKKFVDPKLSYPMEQIYDQKLKFTSKKIAATRKQKWQRLEKYFGGITKMAKMNTKQISKNVAIIIGQQEEMNAIQECRKLGMKIFAVVDTNCNPKFVDHIIPANDDSRNSIKYILGEMLSYIHLGQKLRQKVALRAKLQQNRKRRFEFR